MNIVSTAWLSDRLGSTDLVVVDLRWMHSDRHSGLNAYLGGHIPGAIFLALDTDLSDLSDPKRGRHPLPNPDRFARTLSEAGIGRETQLVAYDDTAGTIAARLWWMMRWIGLPSCAVLDGGIAKWKAEARPLEFGQPRNIRWTSDPISASALSNMILDKVQVAEATSRGFILLDARAPERYRGEVEPIDARAGHIPGALNAPCANNLTSNAVPTFRKPEELRSLYQNIGVSESSRVVCYCGSGVTACHDILALEMAGFPNARLYPGSWSEWIANEP
jgi:thiosulfate/3-mercaptopyruvate sulfurtransferase